MDGLRLWWAGLEATVHDLCHRLGCQMGNGLVGIDDCDAIVWCEIGARQFIECIQGYGR